MQCPVCKFQNMPDEEFCTNCKAFLRAYGIPAYPPREKGFKKIRIFFTYLAMLFDSYSPSFERSDEGKVREPIDVIGNIKFFLNPENPDQFWKKNRWIAAILSIIPGLGHLVLLQFRMALYFFGAFVLFILMYIAVPDTVLGVFMRAGIIGTMAIAILSTSPMDFLVSRRPSSRFLFSIIIYVFILFLIIRPFTNNCFDAICVDSLGSVMLEKNIKNRKLFLNKLFFNPSKLRRGDIVIYEEDDYTSGGERIIRRSRNAFERIIGLPGDTVEFKDSLIYVNGEEIVNRNYPLSYSGDGHLPDLKVELSELSFFIYPYSILSRIPRNLDDELVDRLCKKTKFDFKGKAIPYM